jgi:hypothetical protein
MDPGWNDSPVRLEGCNPSFTAAFQRKKRQTIDCGDAKTYLKENRNSDYLCDLFYFHDFS